MRLAERPTREVFVGNAGRMLAAMRTLAPAVSERVMARQVETDHFQDGQPAPPTDGNLFEPMADHYGARGGWLAREHPQQQRSTGIAIALAVLAVPLGFYVWARQRGASRVNP